MGEFGYINPNKYAISDELTHHQGGGVVFSDD